MPYLFKRRGSDNYYVRLQPPGQKQTERSLGTPDYRAAELAASELVRQHKALMYQRRQARVATVVHGPWQHEYAPGQMHTLPDGRTLIATATDLTYADGTRRPNGGPSVYLTGDVGALGAARTFAALDAAWAGEIGPGPVETDRPKFIAAKSTGDDALLERYITEKALTPQREREAREMWRIFRVVVNKPLADCDRDDGRAIVEYLVEQSDEPLKSATLRRRMVPLVAVVSLAIKNNKYKNVNPFASVAPDRGDANERDAYSDDDIKLMRDNLHKLDAEDQLLVRIMATTGMRRGEAFEITKEETANGIRFCTIGADKGGGKRRVPFPADLLDHLPAKIVGSLFTRHPDGATKRLRAWLTEIGIVDGDGKLIAPSHSFRHRAHNRMRDGLVREDVREAVAGWIGGKGSKTGKRYGNKHGAGFAISILKDAIDKIGF